MYNSKGPSGKGNFNSPKIKDKNYSRAFKGEAPNFLRVNAVDKFKQLSKQEDKDTNA